MHRPCQHQAWAPHRDTSGWSFSFFASCLTSFRISCRSNKRNSSMFCLHTQPQPRICARTRAAPAQVHHRTLGGFKRFFSANGSCLPVFVLFTTFCDIDYARGYGVIATSPLVFKSASLLRPDALCLSNV